MVEHWQVDGDLLLTEYGHDARAVLATAMTLALIHGAAPGDCIRVNLSDTQVAWCRTFSTGWSCVALAPRDELHTVDVVARDTFFAAAWPKHWITARRIRSAEVLARDIPFAEGGMCWAKHPTGRVVVAQIAGTDPLCVQLTRHAEPVLASETALSWRTLQYNVEGWRMEWMDGRHHIHNFKLGAMRAGLRLKRAATKTAKVEDTRTPAEKAAAKAERTRKWLEALNAGKARKKAEREAGLAAAKAEAGKIRQGG